jgi:glutamate-ammonia-ligase adenylyltransferase
VQYLILGYACEHPGLTENIGNIALLKLASNLGLIRRETGERALSAYREFRRVQHRLRLSGDANLTGPASTGNKSQKFVRVEVEQFGISIAAVLQLWGEVLTP